MKMRVIIETPSGLTKRGFLIGNLSIIGSAGQREVCVVRLEETGEVVTINARRVKEDPMEAERLASAMVAGAIGAALLGLFYLTLEALASIMGWIFGLLLP